MGLMQVLRSNLKLAIVVCFLITTALCADTPTSWSWLQATSFGGSGDDSAAAVQVGSDGSQYFTGRFSSLTQFGTTLLTSNGGEDIFLAKADPSGILWAIQAGGTNDDWGTALALDGANNIYLTGMFYNSATFGSTDGSTIPVTGTGYTIFLAKYNPSGVVAWVQTGTGSDYNWGYGVAVEPNTGTVYLVALSTGGTRFSSANGNHHRVPGNGYWHMVLAKYDTDGNFHWGETNAARPNSIGLSVAVDKNASAYVVGWLENKTTFNSRNGKNITITGFSPGQSDNNYPGDGFLVKYDSRGNAKWVNHFGGYIGHAQAVAVSPAGEISLVGDIGNIDYGSSGEASTIVTSRPPGKNIDLGGGEYTNPYNHDAIVATYNSLGVLKKALRIGGPQNEMATGVAYDVGGLLHVSGFFQSPFDIGNRHLHGNDQQNLFVLQYSGKNLRKVATAANATVWSSWTGSGLSVDSNGNVFVVGTYQDTARFGNINLGDEGVNMFLAELAPN